MKLTAPALALLFFPFLLLLSVPANAQNQSIQGSLCVGIDCATSETFGSDTQRFKDNNIRVHFDDASTSGSFPTNDWRITVNSDVAGGPSFFGIDDVTGGFRPFVIEASTQANAFVINGDGNDFNDGYVGIGTDTPEIEIHVSHGDSPGLRLDQNDSEGWGRYAWDVVGNEANFFVRNVTAGASSGSAVLPFRILPTASNNNLVLSGGTVGIGTASTEATLNIVAAQPTILVQNTTTGTDALALDANGNLTLSGVLTEASSLHRKENRRPVDGEVVLAKLADLPVETWNYRTDDPAIRHMGPMAQEFYAAFGLGIGEEYLAPLDANGVALAASKALLTRVETADRQIEALAVENEMLAAENKALRARIARLEHLVQQFMQQPSNVPSLETTE
jgi:hypothetical protein